MQIDINQRLYDLALRQAIYVERVKVGQWQEFNKTLSDLSDEFSKILFRTKYKTLDALSKVELNKLLLNLRVSQGRIYNAYTSKIIAQLEAFMKADLTLSQIALASTLAGRTLNEDEAISFMQEEKKSNSLFGILAVTSNTDSLWSSIKNSPVPANGNLPLSIITGFAAMGSAALENIVRLGYVNKYSTNDIYSLAFDDENVNGNVSLSRKLSNQNKTNLATVISDVHSLTYSGVASILFSGYMWHSILDSGTTQICRSRSNSVYQYGKGPLPPAHERCRSSVVPFSGAFAGDSLPPTLLTWYETQPDDVKSDLFSESELENIRKSGKFEAQNGLNLQQYRDKLSNLLK
ncbi:minor capsid protein [Erwinia phage AH03]|uniref:Minor capsid protein n=1 Tax=Erwinia phage AH03 TaxID=2869568 RepID=A0AAE7X196_9CAUD|nr:minor capsid protein [Erwinia phage AH03]